MIRKPVRLAFIFCIRSSRSAFRRLRQLAQYRGRGWRQCAARGGDKVTRHDLSSTLEIASEFQPYQEVNVYAKVSGYIKTLDVDWGTHVKQGQLLAVLEIPELQQQFRR